MKIIVEITCYNILPQAAKGNVDVLKSDLVDKIRDTHGWTPLHYVAQHRIETIDHPSVDKVCTDWGTTPLHEMAVNFGPRLLDHKSIDKIRDKTGVTPLHYIAWHDSDGILDHPSVCGVLDYSDETPLHYYVRSSICNYEKVKMKFDWFNFKKYEKYTKKGNFTELAKMKVITELVNVPNSAKFIREKK